MSKLPYECCIVTAKTTKGKYDFVSRFFGPNIGIPEDPVTGAAHTILTPFWHERLGKCELYARQVSKRGGDLRLKLDGERVLMEGQAVSITNGKLFA